MTRVVLALTAILVLALSAGLHQTQLQSSPRDQAAGAFAATSARQAIAAEIDVALASSRPAPAPARATREEAPSPALLAYLGLVLVGSAVAVGVVYRGQHRKF